MAIAPHRPGHLRQRARGGEGRAADARRQSAVRPAERDHLRPGVHDASVQAPDDRQHGGSRSRVDRRRARFLLRRTTCRRTRRWCSSATSTRRRRSSSSSSTSAACRRPSARCRATFRRSRRRRRSEASRCETPWPLPAVVVAYHITYDGHPDSYPLHIASKVLSDGQSSRIYQKLVYEQQLAVAAFGGANLIEDPNLFYAVAIVQPGQKPEDAVTRSSRSSTS